MKAFSNKLSLMQKYLQELETSIFWHYSMMSWIRQANSQKNSAEEYPQLVTHSLSMVKDRKDARDLHLSLARKFRNELENLK